MTKMTFASMVPLKSGLTLFLRKEMAMLPKIKIAQKGVYWNRALLSNFKAPGLVNSKHFSNSPQLSNVRWLNSANRVLVPNRGPGAIVFSEFMFKRGFNGQPFQINNTGSKPKVSKVLLRMLKTVCLVTGACVWVALVVVFVMVEDVKVKNSETDLSVDQESMMRTLKFYGITKQESWNNIDEVLKSERAEEIQEEIKSKEFALSRIWEKLKNEEGIQLTFGTRLYICGYKCGESNAIKDQMVDDPEDSNMWKANCFIEGTNGTIGALSIMFERASTEAEWIATRVFLEIVKETGDIICNVSGQLPNGLKNFTRLSNL